MIDKRMREWLNKRIPANSEHHLTLNSIFILPTGFGWSFLIMTICLFLLGTNYQNNLMLLLSYLCLSVMLLTLFYSHQNFARLALKARTPEPFYCHQQGTFQLTLVNHKDHRKPCSGNLSLRWLNANTQRQPDSKSAQNQESIEVALTDGDSYQTENQVPLTVLVPIRFPQRGKHSLGRLTITSDFPLGLYKCWTHLDFNQEVWVYPQPIEGPAQLLRHLDNNDTKLQSAAPNEASTSDFYALADYQEGQPLNRVAWKHVAKNEKWVTKQFSSQQSETVVVSAPPGLEVEQAISLLTHNIERQAARNNSFGLSFYHINIPPNCGAKHLQECLESLATFEFSPVIMPHKKRKPA